MAALIKILREGTLHDVAYSADTLKEAAVHEPDEGVYTVASTRNRFQVMKLTAHFDRLEDSARRAGMNITIDRATIKAALREMMVSSGFDEGRFRVTIPRKTPEAIILSIEAFTPPSEAMLDQGVNCMTVANSARHNAAAKTTDWMHQRAALRNAMPEGIYETFLRDVAGNILEGLGSNFYAVLDGELRTAEAGVLRGISQQIVLEVAPAILPIRFDAVHYDSLSQCTDTFLSSSTRGIIPVVRIDDLQIGTGKPGAMTQALRAAYEDRVDSQLEAL